MPSFSLHDGVGNGCEGGGGMFIEGILGEYVYILPRFGK